MFHELWSDVLAPDSTYALYNFAKFAQPTIANGKVYVPTFSGQVIVYGLLDNSSTSGAPVSGRGGAARAVKKQ